MEDKFLGKMCKDKVSGFTGVATAKCEYLGGFQQYQLTAKSADNKVAESDWFYENRVEIVEDGVHVAL